MYNILRWFLRLTFFSVWRPVVEGQEFVPASGAVIVASNHLSFADSVVLPLALPHRKITFLAKSDYFAGKGLFGRVQRWWFLAMGAMPLERDAQRDAQAQLRVALDVLSSDAALGIYPEGTRSRDGRLYRGRTGVGYLALESNAPVVPVGLIGTDKVQPVGARFPRIRRVHVRFGPPIHPKDYAEYERPAIARRQLTDDVMNAIAEMSGQERADGYNERTPAPA